MNCDDVLVYLSEYIDHELDTELTQAAQAHLATCQNCQIVLNTTRQVIILGGGEHQRTIPVTRRSTLFNRLQEAFLCQPNNVSNNDEPV